MGALGWTWVLALVFGGLMTPWEGRAQEGKLPVTASIVPLAHFCEKMGGDRVEVQVLVPPGASPHTYEPTPSVIATASRARLFVYVGQGLEPWADRILKSRRKEELMVVEAAKGLPLIGEAGRQEHPGGAHQKQPHRHLGVNPHVWLDPVLAKEICKGIAGALMKIDPAHKEVYQRNLEAYLGELEALHLEIEAEVSKFRIREYVCFHPAYVYFSRRYGLKEAGVIELSPGREPTPRHVQKIVSAIKSRGIKVVFAEPQLSPRVAEAIAGEVGVRVAVLDPLGGIAPYGSDYLALMRHNLRVLEEAMGDN